MVNELGELLNLPNLEDSTIALINEKMRLLIGEIKPETPEMKQEVISLMQEYFNGKVGE